MIYIFMSIAYILMYVWLQMTTWAPKTYLLEYAIHNCIGCTWQKDDQWAKNSSIGPLLTGMKSIRAPICVLLCHCLRVWLLIQIRNLISELSGSAMIPNCKNLLEIQHIEIYFLLNIIACALFNQKTKLFWLQLDCPSVRHWDGIETASYLGLISNLRPFLDFSAQTTRASYLIFLVKPKNGLVWPVFAWRRKKVFSRVIYIRASKLSFITETS